MTSLSASAAPLPDQFRAEEDTLIVWPGGSRLSARLWPRARQLVLIARAVIHVVDLPGTLSPTPLVGIGYL
jgi:hypothetical protein